MTVFLYNNICHTYSRVEFRDVEWLSTFIAAECENVSNFRRVGQTKFSKHLTISALGGINLCPFPSHRSLSVLPHSPVNMSVCAFTGVLASGVQRLLWTEASRNSRKPPEHHHVIHYISILLCHTYLMASIYLTVQCASYILIRASSSLCLRDTCTEHRTATWGQSPHLTVRFCRQTTDLHWNQCTQDKVRIFLFLLKIKIDGGKGLSPPLKVVLHRTYLNGLGLYNNSWNNDVLLWWTIYIRMIPVEKQLTVDLRYCVNCAKSLHFFFCKINWCRTEWGSSTRKIICCCERMHMSNSVMWYRQHKQ